MLLFLLTVFTTLAVGARLHRNFLANRPPYDLDRDLNPFSGLWRNPEMLLNGIPFSATLLAILFAHEMGHFLACRHYGIAASYPYFIPAPTILGTMGAFIRIQSPIYSRRALFDVGVAGPLAGFVLAVPLLAVGLAASKVSPSSHFHGAIAFGNPLLVRLVDFLFHPGASIGNLNLHPVARAAWVGLFATALNLLPVGQLDGGHIMYSLSRRWHTIVSRMTVALLGLPMLAITACWILGRWLPTLRPLDAWLMSHYWTGWFLWSAILLLLGMRHPPVRDPQPLDASRLRLALAAAVVFFLCFTPTPFRT